MISNLPIGTNYLWGNVFSQYIWPTVSLNSYLGLEDMLMYKFNAQLIAVGMIIWSLGKRPQAVCARTLLEQ